MNMWAASLAGVLLLVTTAFGEERQGPDRYSALWVVTGGSAGGSSVSIDIRINRYSTDEEIKKFADILVEGGPDRLRRALEAEDVGQLSPAGRVGTAIAVARKTVRGDKTMIRVVTARNVPFIELNYSGRSVDYPFMILEMKLDRNGKGAGRAVAAAKIRFNKKENKYEIQSLQRGTAYNKLLNVQAMK